MIVEDSPSPKLNVHLNGAVPPVCAAVKVRFWSTFGV